MQEKLHEISKLLESLGDFTGASFCWHFADNDLLRQVLTGQIDHCNTFCLRVKRDPCWKLRSCMKEHRVRAFQEALELRRPFLFRCYAGAKEVAVPLFDHDRLFAVLSGGIFQDDRHSPPEEALEEYKRLPRMDDDRLLRLGVFLERLLWREIPELRLPEERSQLLPSLTSRDDRILRAAAYMRLNLFRPVTAAETAAQARLSTSHFLHLFSRETGFSFSDWLLRLRVSEARRLVEGSSIPLKNIAESCGIVDQSRMALLFRRYLGETPAALRKRSAPSSS